MNSRYECKYLVPACRVGELRRWLEMFLQPDRYATRCPGGAYTIGSLYLDSADLRLYRMTKAGVGRRFKLRIRQYGKGSEGPVFLEVKRRLGQVISKLRARLEQGDARRVLTGETGAEQAVRNGNGQALGVFLGLAGAIVARPAAHVWYERIAYESPSCDTVRVTLDYGLRCARARGSDLLDRGGACQPVPMRGVLLEVKFMDCFPPWIHAMVRHFELQRIPFSKYGLSADQLGQPARTVPYLPQGGSAWMHFGV